MGTRSRLKRGTVLATTLGFLQLASINLGVEGAPTSPPVNVALRSSWPAPPFLIETLETISLESPEAFFTLIGCISKPDAAIPYHKLTPEAAHTTLLKDAATYGLLTENEAHTFLGMHLSLHASTPKIEAFYQYYRSKYGEEGQDEGSQCGSWVDWYGQVVCDVETLQRLAGDGVADAQEAGSEHVYDRPKLLPFDHIYPLVASTLERPPRTAILYGSVESSNLHELHSALMDIARKPEARVEYVFRHVPPKAKISEKNYLSGYGVALDLKKMDYLAVDDRNAHHSTSQKGDTAVDQGSETEVDPILELMQTLAQNGVPDKATDSETEPTDPNAPLTKAEIEELGYQASQLIYSSDDPLGILINLSQNFPKYATSLSRLVKVEPDVRTELDNNAVKAQGGTNMFWLNGALVEETDVNVLALIRLMKKERTIMHSLTSLGILRDEAMRLLTHQKIALKQREGGVLDGLVDASDREEGGGTIVYLNDLEKDARYARWSSSLHGLVRAMFPGQFPSVRLNLFNIVLVLDLSKISNMGFMFGTMGNIVERGYPFRVGVVPSIDTTDGLKMARLLYHMFETYGTKVAMEYYRGVLPPLLDQPTVQWDLLEAGYDEYLDLHDTNAAEDPERKIPERVAFKDVVNGQGPIQVPTDKILSYTKRLAVGEAGALNDRGEEVQGHAFVNGRYFEYSDNFLRAMQTETASQLNHLQEQVYEGRLADDEETQAMIQNHFYDLPSTTKRRNVYIVPKSTPGSPASLRIWNLPELFAKTGWRTSPWTYVYPEGTSDIPVGMYVVADFDTELGFELAREILLYMTDDVGTRVTFIHNPTDPSKVPVSEPLSVTWDEPDKVPLSRIFAHLLYENLASATAPRLILKALGVPFYPQPPSSPVVLTDQSDPTAPPHIDGLPRVASADHPLQVPITQQTKMDIREQMKEEEESWDEDALGPKPKPMKTILTRRDAIDELVKGREPSDFRVDDYADYVKRSRLMVREFRLKPGERAVIANGRLVGPFKGNHDEFVAQDFGALELYEVKKRAAPVVDAVFDVLPYMHVVKNMDRPSFANLVSLGTSVITSIQQPDPSEVGLFDAPLRPRQMTYHLLDSNYTSFESGLNITAIYQFSALIDPLSETAQKWAPILEWLSTIPNTFIEIHMNPARSHDIPLKRFYRYNILHNLEFNNEGHEKPSQAVFSNLPIDPIYTLAMDVSSSWLVRPREALYDLDNIQLGKLAPEDTSVDAVFDLDYIVVDGHAREGGSKMPPRGLQLQLVNAQRTVKTKKTDEGEVETLAEEEDKPIADTQVMANLGYMQFKAKPGVFKLEIRPGRGRDIYEMESVGNEGWDSPTVSIAGSEITVTSFEGLTLYPRLKRRPGQELASVLEDLTPKDDNANEGILGGWASKIKSVFGAKEPELTAVATTQQQAEINIFTVASGLLYERFVGIMILSVLRNTKSTVKFWFIENFLSPSFLEFIPHLAEAYNFQYELVTYKWPSWLRAQKEKQRIIWAYKILFLDVLFPMDLKKVIFVDADQIVRADLKELVDLDLHGAPYGYTPMGDDNTDMEGFRFWKTGYWRDFLQGKPYHISALYVVDLVRFRQLAAGDHLRGQYHQLSADPNSLANLDQDLPNNLQNEVPIFSLHEDWLWCETWCSKDRLHRAKTIDLCQNPLTKEPKLSRARQIPEWEEYDAEISRFARKLAEEGRIKSRIAAADTNVLASEGSTNAAVPESTTDKPKEPEVDKMEGEGHNADETLGDVPRDEL